jgi:hypothetical protein
VEKINLPKKIGSVQNELDSVNNTVASLRKKWGKKSKPRAEIENILAEKKAKFGNASFVYKIYKRQVELSTTRLTEAESLLKLAQKSGEGKFKLPKDYYIRLLSRRVLTYSASVNNLSKIIEREGQVLVNKLSGKPELKFIKEDVTGIAKKIFDPEEFSKSAQEFESLYRSVMSLKDQHIFRDVPVEEKKDFKEFLTYCIKLLNNESFRQHYGFSEVSQGDINVFMKLLSENPQDLRVLNISSKIFLRIIRPYVKKLDKQYDSVKKAKVGRDEAIRKKTLIETGNETFLGDDAYRSVEWGENYYRESEISELGNDLSENLDSEAKDFSRLRTLGFAKHLPQIVDKDGFRQAIEKSYPVMQNTIERNKLWVQYEVERNPINYENSKDYMYRLANLNASIDALKQAQWFLQNLDSRFLRFDIASGMKTKRYLELISKKVILINRLIKMPKLRDEYEKMGPEVETLETELKLFKALKRRTLVAETLDTLKAIDPLANHIGRMKDLGLAVKASD